MQPCFVQRACIGCDYACPIPAGRPLPARGVGIVFRVDLEKPDGRRLWLYGREPMPHLVGSPAPTPDPQPVQMNSHLRWHPMTGEWVIYAAHRQNRTFMPAEQDNPLAPAQDPSRPTELPPGPYDVAVFENRFPSLSPEPGPLPDLPGLQAAPGLGRCEVVVFSQEPSTSLGRLSAAHLNLIIEVWADRTRDMAADGLSYVLPFENRGVEMGVTLHHPHGQIYGYGFVPAVQARAAANLKAHLDRAGIDFVSTLSAAERSHQIRLVVEREHALAFVPPFGRFPYEIWIAPTRPVQFLSQLNNSERDEVAAVLSESLRRLDGLWNRPMPYLLTVNQAPTDGAEHPEWSLRIEIWPIRRSPEKLKFLAGTELGAGVFACDVLPETAAAELRQVIL